MANSPKEALDFPCAEATTPHAASSSTVIVQRRLYLFASLWKFSTITSSLPSPRRYLGVSTRRMTVTRRTLRTKTIAEAVYIKYLHPLLLSYVQVVASRQL